MNKPLHIKLFLSSCFLIILSSGFSQSVELYGGVNNNKFYNCSYDDGGWQEYSSDSKWGYNFGIAYENLELKPLNIRLTLGFENYNGHITYTDGSHGYFATTNVEITKTVITFGFYPVNIRIKKRLKFNLGLLLAGLINEQEKGTVTGWSATEGVFSREFNESNAGYSPLLHIGLSARFAYDFELNDIWYVSPQYSYYLGFMSEFNSTPFNSMRHFVGIGIKRDLK